MWVNCYFFATQYGISTTLAYLHSEIPEIDQQIGNANFFRSRLQTYIESGICIKIFGCAIDGDERHCCNECYNHVDV